MSDDKSIVGGGVVPFHQPQGKDATVLSTTVSVVKVADNSSTGASNVTLASSSVPVDKTANSTWTVHQDDAAEIYGNLDYAYSEYKYMAAVVLGLLIIMTAGLSYTVCYRMKGGSSMKKASCILLLAIAVSNMLTVAATTVEIIFLYVMKTRHGAIPFESCSTLNVLERLAIIPHAASIWFTVALSFQCYICVARPFMASVHVNVKSCLIVIACVSAASIVLHICRFVDNKFEPVNIILRSKPEDPLLSCTLSYATWISNPVTYESVFAWTTVILVHFLPCLALVGFSILLGKGLNQPSGIKKKDTLGDRKRISILALVVASMVCVVEIPAGIVIGLNAIRLSSGILFIDYTTIKKAALGLDLALYVSYFIVFFVYCIMARDMRVLIGNITRVIACCKTGKPNKNDANTSDSTESNETIPQGQASAMNRVKRHLLKCQMFLEPFIKLTKKAHATPDNSVEIEDD